MTSTAHALVAGAIASKFPDPVIATSLAFASHFILDSIPHWDVGTNWRVRAKTITGIFAIVETLLGITVTYFLFGGNVDPFLLFITIIASLLPDWLETPWYIFFAKNAKNEPDKHASLFERTSFMVYKMENGFHAKLQFPMGLVTQIFAVLFFIILLK